MQVHGLRQGTGCEKLSDFFHMSAGLVFRRKLFQRDQRCGQRFRDDPSVVTRDSLFWHRLPCVSRTSNRARRRAQATSPAALLRLVVPHCDQRKFSATRLAWGTLLHLLRWFALPRGHDLARFVDVLLEPADDLRHPLTCIFFSFSLRGRLLRIARWSFRRLLQPWL